MIVKGDLLEHITDIAGETQPDDLFALMTSGLIELDQISTNQHRITICELVPQEQPV